MLVPGPVLLSRNAEAPDMLVCVHYAQGASLYIFIEKARMNLCTDNWFVVVN